MAHFQFLIDTKDWPGEVFDDLCDELDRLALIGSLRVSCWPMDEVAYIVIGEEAEVAAMLFQLRFGGFYRV